MFGCVGVGRADRICAVLCRSLAFISLLIPAWAALVGIGALISASDLNFWPIWIAGSVGAAAGDWLSYWVGLKLENRVYHMWPLSQHPTIIPAGEAFVRKWGSLRSSSATLGAAPRVGAAHCRRVCDAILALSGRELRLGVRLGRRAAHARRRHLVDDQMARQADGRLKKNCRGFAPAEPISNNSPRPISSRRRQPGRFVHPIGRYRHCSPMRRRSCRP